MAAPFCNACGATIAEGTRFCVKCGQPVGQAAPPPVAQTLVFTPAAPPPPPPPAPAPSVLAPPVAETQIWTPPPPPPPQAPPPAPPQIMPVPAMPPPAVQPPKDGPGAGLWIGIFGILLLLGGTGLWFYTTRTAHVVSTVQVATAPPESPAAQPSPTPDPTPTPASTLVAAPTPNPTTEVIPPNPDQAPPKQPVQSRPQPAPTAVPPSSNPAPSNPAPPQPVRAARQTSGVLHASVEVAQNGEVVFENLPGARLKFTFDHSLWQPTISHQANGTQTLVMRSLKAGIQTSCDVRWEIVQ